MAKTPIVYPAPWNYPVPPKNIKILNRNVAVEPMTHAEAIQTEAIGMAKRGHNVIALHPCIPFENAQDTMLHEVFHFLWADLLPGQEEGKEEQAVSVLSTGLFNVMQRNPKLVAWLTAPPPKE